MIKCGHPLKYGGYDEIIDDLNNLVDLDYQRKYSPAENEEEFDFDWLQPHTRLSIQHSNIDDSSRLVLYFFLLL